jgi:hypothetical protein
VKISKGLMLAAAFLFVLNLTACGSKYSDVEGVMNAQATAMKNYIDAMEKAENAEDVAASINGFTSEMKVLIPQLKEVMAKYPELSEEQAPPEELQAVSEEMRIQSENLQGAMMKVMQYMQDPGVKKAIQDQGRIMMEMAKE